MCLTYPKIGNYGVNRDDAEAAQALDRGSDRARALAGRQQLPRERGPRLVPADAPASSASRASTRGGSSGACASTGASTASSRASISTGDRLVARAKAAPDMNGLDLVKVVSCSTRRLPGPRATRRSSRPGRRWPRGAKRHAIVAIDYGMKRNILRSLVASRLRSVGRARDARAPTAILARKPDGRVPLERPRRPGRRHLRDPDDQGAARQGARLRHLPRPPADGARRRRQDLQVEVRPSRRQPAGAWTSTRGRVEITSQNHGFAVDVASLAKTRLPRDAHEPERRHERGHRVRGAAARSRSSTTPRRPPGPTTPSTCSAASAASSRPARSRRSSRCRRRR